jgi:alpha-glucosidase
LKTNNPTTAKKRLNIKIIQMKKTSLILIVSICCSLLSNANNAPVTVKSPDGKTVVNIKLREKIYYNVSFKEQKVIWYSPLTLTVDNKTTTKLGFNPALKSKKIESFNETIETVWGKRKNVTNKYNQLTMSFDNDYSVIFRVYNDGVAYRFKTDIKGDIKVINEEVAYRFLEDYDVMMHPVTTYQTSFEELYEHAPISEIGEDPYLSLPVLFKLPKNIKAVITEADLYDYPGLYLYREEGNSRYDILGKFPELPSSWEVGGWSQFDLVVTSRHGHIAETTGKRKFPWRVMIITDDDRQLADNDLVYKLSRPAKIETDWIKPGKVTWEWWNDWNLEGVDFETGINNETYKYYIDFASENNIPYVMLDEGWSDQFDLTLQRPNIDVPMLIEYADKKDVKLILWCIWQTLDRQMHEALDLFEKWGAAGIKVDFFDRDDQIVINAYEEIAKEAAKRKLVVDYHGCSKPTGLSRTYPNVLNYEGVRGNEYNKFNTDETPGHNIDIVFTRMLTGPMDYTPGAMRNTEKGNFYTSNSKPMSYGTRCHQLAMFVVYEAPMQMLCDAPTQYEKYPDILNFLSHVPVTWDETQVLSAKLSNYVVIARKKDNEWYIGAMTDWTEREITIDLSFLDEGEHTAEIFKDGINANKLAEDYAYEKKKVNNNTTLKITLKQGGGAALRIY